MQRDLGVTKTLADRQNVHALCNQRACPPLRFCKPHDMKGRMSRRRLEAWTSTAAALRDETKELWRAAKTPEEKAAIIDRDRRQLNR